MDNITLTPTQKKNLRILLLLGLAVFILFAIPNAQGAEDEYMLSVLSQDESFQYPFLVGVLTPGDTLLESIKISSPITTISTDTPSTSFPAWPCCLRV